MRKVVVVGLLLLGGCRSSTVGPFESRRPERVDDPRLTISEQQRRGRDRLPLPVESSLVGPMSGVEAMPGIRGGNLNVGATQ